jgi:hypothetical protein
MTLEALAAFGADMDYDLEPAAPRQTSLPTHCQVPDPEAGWARRNPDRALAFLFVSPRDCAAIDELMAA